MLACQSPERPAAVDPAAEEAAVFRRAAGGDHDAQVDMAWRALGRSVDAKSRDAALNAALLWSNMAATSGKADHALAFASILMVQANDAPFDQAQEVYAQVLAIANSAADVGHGSAEAVAIHLAEHLPAATIAKAQAMSAAITFDALTADERVKVEAREAWVRSKLNELEKGRG